MHSDKVDKHLTFVSQRPGRAHVGMIKRKSLFQFLFSVPQATKTRFDSGEVLFPNVRASKPSTFINPLADMTGARRFARPRPAISDNSRKRQTLQFHSRETGPPGRLHSMTSFRTPRCYKLQHPVSAGVAKLGAAAYVGHAGTLNLPSPVPPFKLKFQSIRREAEDRHLQHIRPCPKVASYRICLNLIAIARPRTHGERDRVWSATALRM